MSRHRNFRDHLPFTPQHEPYFRWRGQEVSRIEGFSDAVFAFAVTLLVVALEVPNTFDGLMGVIRGFPAFIASFSLLMLFWNAHYKFFRRYGLDDAFVRWVNHGILLMVLCAVYPLKFVFSALFSPFLGGGEFGAHIENASQAGTIFRYYGLGFAVSWSLFALLHWHALRRAGQLRLTPTEILLTRMTLTEFLIYISVCELSIILTFTSASPAVCGFVYIILGPLMAWNGAWHGRQVRALTARQSDRRGT
jgi:uncharacterized membrane protein